MGMSYLIDTHILLWWLFDDQKLHTDCRDIIRNPDHRIIVSSASAWEIATKYRMGKLPEAKQLVEQYSQILHQAKFIELAITTVHALRAGSLPIAHRDPFDRTIVAQAELESLAVITYDKAFQTGLIHVIPDL
ncbi:MAG: type II toxin-antitoxin system VapC family toxin [Nostoc sp. NMS1]|nr:type II toxin-antitoxin system VapC family toxin [Nostoc sp. NMS1]MBN3993639.1 type II toxin-antitoxin system VapC family toxin [Nostoc sp. NMS2]